MTENLHIIHVMLSLDVGGLERNVLNQARQAPRVGQRVTIICLERPGELAPQVELLGSRVISLDKRPGLRFGLIGRLKRLFRELSPDVVHTHQISSLLYAGPAAKGAGVPLVVHTEHGKERYAQRFRTRLLGRIAGQYCSTFFCLTEDMAAEIRSQRIVPASKISVIFNGIDTAQYAARCDTQPLRRSLGIPDGAPVIGTVGRLTEVKRQDVLIRAFAKVKQSVPAAHLVIVGDGPLRKELEDQAVACGVGDSVHLAGYQSATSAYVQLMNIFTLTSRSEGMPQAALEASVAGVPVVASRVGGLPELIEDGRTGLLLPPGDEGALASALCDLLADPQRARRMGEAANARVIGKFDISRMARDYNEHFLKLLGTEKASLLSQFEKKAEKAGRNGCAVFRALIL